MSINDIPVRVIGPGSQPVSDAEKITYMDMPGDMSTYVAPAIPDPDDVMHMDGAREAMQWLRKALANYSAGAEPVFADLSALSDECRELVNQVLGEGEVSITRDGDVKARTQEAVLAGVWRTLLFDDDENVVCDLLEVAEVPQLARLPRGFGSAVDTSVEGVAPELSNAPPILVELESRCREYAETGTPHSINLTLLPLSDAELEFLDERLGRGPVDILSRAYGKCQVISTRTPAVWWVRYYNSMGTLILNTLEVVEMPGVVAAAPEDLADSAERLAEILEPYWSDVA
jgi:hydrogenase-1 operon protein HyaF